MAAFPGWPQPTRRCRTPRSRIFSVLSGRGPACDLAFADLLLYAPVDSGATSFVVLGTFVPHGPTSHAGDPVGRIVASSARPMVQRCSSTACASRVRWRSRFRRSPRHHRARGQSSNWTRRHGRPCAGASRGRDHRGAPQEGEAGLTKSTVAWSMSTASCSSSSDGRGNLPTRAT